LDYWPDELDVVFHEWRWENSSSNRTEEISYEEDLAAFRKLLEAKGNAIAPNAGETPSVSSTPTFEEPVVDENDETEEYEDALEHMVTLSLQQEAFSIITATG
jgi:hypothetical protein